jgi:hypothetical protein
MSSKWIVVTLDDENKSEQSTEVGEKQNAIIEFVQPTMVVRIELSDRPGSDVSDHARRT